MRRFDEWLRSLSSTSELIIVIVVAFGWFIFVSVRRFVANILTMAFDDVPPWPLILTLTERSLILLVLEQVSIILVLGWFLRRRGWTLAQLGFVGPLRPVKGSLASTNTDQALWGVGVVLWGVGLAVAAWVALIFIPLALTSLMPDLILMSTVFMRSEPTLGIGVVLLASLINPIFEEVFLCGYLISKLTPARGAWFAIIVSTVIRFIIHLYQGFIDAVSMIPLGLMFAYWFANRRQLWPVIVAHACLDLLPFFAARYGVSFFMMS